MANLFGSPGAPVSGLSIEPNSSRNSQGCGQEVKKGFNGAFRWWRVEGGGGGDPIILFDPPPSDPPQMNTFQELILFQELLH